MKAYALAGVLALALAACSGDGEGDGTTADTAHNMGIDTQATGSHGGMADTGMAHGQMGGDMSQQMEQMNQMMVQVLGPADSTYEQRFIDHMITHHQGAIMMAEDAMQKTGHPELKQFAQRVIEAQRSEIDDLKRWRQEWYGDSVTATMSSQVPMSMDEMNRQMVAHLGTADSTYDDRFIDMMIPHHRGAVMMAQDAVAKATRTEIKNLAQKIINDQNREIAKLEAWRSQWFGH
jgi:uncharacterized protein (DUF305 family)